MTVTSSFGVHWTMGEECDGQEVVNEADAALYRAKQNGRNQVEAAHSHTTLLQ